MAYIRREPMRPSRGIALAKTPKRQNPSFPGQPAFIVLLLQQPFEYRHDVGHQPLLDLIETSKIVDYFIGYGSCQQCPSDNRSPDETN